MRFLLSFILFFATVFTTGAQDTLRLMHYNLLMYGNDFGGCNQANNNVEAKNAYLKTIVDYVRPDILSVNEIYREDYYHDLLLENVFNTGGINYFERGFPPNLSNGYTLNNVFFDSRKLELVSNSVAATGVRDIDLFRFKYVHESYADSNVRLNCAVAHLKAGNSDDDRTERASQTFSMMQYLSNSTQGNYILAGDLNLYTGAETAFQNLLFFPNEDARFYDPVNMVGEWHNNSNFADVHSQSTHISGNCPSGGGLDDRFDFILVSEEILEGDDNIKMAENSYRTIGQDGLRFNASLTSDPNNFSAPADVITALYNMSDHLPIVLDLVIGSNLDVGENRINNLKLAFENPVKDVIKINYKTVRPSTYRITLTGPLGHTHYSATERLDGSQGITIPTTYLSNGLYMLHFASEEFGSLYRKVIISK